MWDLFKRLQDQDWWTLKDFIKLIPKTLCDFPKFVISSFANAEFDDCFEQKQKVVREIGYKVTK